MNVVGSVGAPKRREASWLLAVGRYELKPSQAQLHQSVKVGAIELQRQNFDEAGKVFIATSAVLLAFNCIDALAPRVLALPSPPLDLRGQFYLIPKITMTQSKQTMPPT